MRLSSIPPSPNPGTGPANPTRIVKTRGHTLETPGAANTTLTTQIQVSNDDGYVVAVSVIAPYVAETAAQAFISVQANGFKPVQFVPLPQLTPVAGMPLVPLAQYISPGTTIEVTLKTAATALDASKAVYLVLHYAK